VWQKQRSCDLSASSAMRNLGQAGHGHYNRALQDLFVAFQAKKTNMHVDEIRAEIVGRTTLCRARS